jgi:formylglycine-generating enzyme required for sulfatase activity
MAIAVAAGNLAMNRLGGDVDEHEGSSSLVIESSADSEAETGSQLAVQDEAPKTITIHGVELVLIPAGTFRMGMRASADEGDAVTLSAFYLAKTEVTNAQYNLYLDENPEACEPEHWENSLYNQPNQPVVGVSWDEVQAYCEWAGLVLPTEAQWEYAARAGATTWYWSGNTQSDLLGVAWFSTNAFHKLHSVGEKEANPFGLFDVHGNVWEWCRDDYGGRERVVRGGGFLTGDRGTRLVERGHWHPGRRFEDVGFRPARGIH